MQLNSIHITHGSEGPAHDPYAVETIKFTDMQGYTVTLVNGSLSGMKLYSESEPLIPFSEGPEALKIFEQMTGMSVTRAVKIYNERFYFEDPMGNPGDYI